MTKDGPNFGTKAEEQSKINGGGLNMPLVGINGSSGMSLNSESAAELSLFNNNIN
jgi:hypothetical protein